MVLHSIDAWKSILRSCVRTAVRNVLTGPREYLLAQFPRCCAVMASAVLRFTARRRSYPQATREEVFIRRYCRRNGVVRYVGRPVYRRTARSFVRVIELTYSAVFPLLIS